MAPRLEVTYKDTVPGLKEALWEGLTEHMHKARPGIEFEYEAVEIPFYADQLEGGTQAAGGDKIGKTMAGSSRVLVGGLAAKTMLKHLYIDLLWVDPNLRQSGVGSALMRKAEEFARSHRLDKVFVDTASFQAPDFYVKLGYKEIYRTTGCFGQAELERIFYRKDIL